MNNKFYLVFAFLLCMCGHSVAQQLTIAAAADLKYAMTDVVAAYRKQHPNDNVTVIYGSSGKIYSQIMQGAPYDLFFSADVRYPQQLIKARYAVGSAQVYGIGRIVLWSNSLDASKMTLQSLDSSKIKRIAIANPIHAPYGQRAVEALKANNVLPRVQHKLVYGENVTQTTQFVQSGNADIGIIALSLALNPQLKKQGGFWLIPSSWHTPLEQAFVITQHGEKNVAAANFFSYMQSAPAKTMMQQYGFGLPQNK